MFTQVSYSVSCAIPSCCLSTVCHHIFNKQINILLQTQYSNHLLIVQVINPAKITVDSQM